MSELLLDPLNPRLPEELQNQSEPDLLRYLWDNASLDEIVQSFVDNGFFEHEPLIAVAEGVGYVVLEGNRRLSALKVLLQEPAAVDAGVEPRLERPLSQSERGKLASVPVYVVADRNEVHKYLGFRHIGGIKTWSAEAKARYLSIEADKAAIDHPRDAFAIVARRVGSNSQGVRNAYTAMAVLRHAQIEYRLPVNEVLERRFGVWTRCMTAKDVRHYIGLNGARRYDELRDEVAELPEPPLREVLADLTTRDDRPPLLRDSRDVTVYGLILRNDHAREVMREHGSLQIARQVVELAALPARIADLRNRIVVARDEAERAEWSEELDEAGDDLFRAARSLRSAIRDIAEEHDSK